MRQRWAGRAVAATVVVVLAGHATVYGTLLADVVYLGVTGAAAAVAWWGALRSGRRAGTVGVAWGVTLSAVGDVLWSVADWTGGSTDVSVADAAYAASYLALAAGLWRMADASGRTRREQVDGWIDGAVVFLGALLVVWQLSLAATLADGSTPLPTRLVWVLYPALDVALIGLVFRLVVTRGRGERAAVVVACGAVAWLGSDLVFCLVDVGGVSVWTDTGWLVGAALLAAATWAAGSVLGEPAEREGAVSAGVGRLAVCLAAVLVPTLIDLLRELTVVPLLRVPVFAGTLVLAVLVFLRAARLLRAEATARAEVDAQQRYSAALAAHSSDAVVVLGSRGEVLSDPAALRALFGEGPSGPLTGGLLLRWSGVEPAEARSVYARVLEAGPGVVVQAELARDGGERWLGVRLIDLRDDADVGGIVLHATDITDRKRAEAALAHLAFHDPLTGLANRALLADRLDAALARRRTSGSVALVLVDLDGFKAVNDTLGHPVGDELLRVVAGRLTSSVRAGDLVARLGGDEFALLIEQHGAGSADAETAAHRVLGLLAEPLLLDGRCVQISGSLGIAVGTAGATGNSLMGDADVAMYAAKDAGRGRVRVFEPVMRRPDGERRLLEGV